MSYRRIASAGGCAAACGLAGVQQQPGTMTSTTEKIRIHNPIATVRASSSYHGNGPAMVETPGTMVSHLRATAGGGGNASDVALATEQQSKMTKMATKGREVSSNDSGSKWRTGARFGSAVGQEQIPTLPVLGDYTRAHVGEHETVQTWQQSAKKIMSAGQVAHAKNVDGGNKSPSAARDGFGRQQSSVAAKAKAGQSTAVKKHLPPNKTQNVRRVVANVGNSMGGNKGPTRIYPRPTPPVTASTVTPGTAHPVSMVEKSSVWGETRATVVSAAAATAVTCPGTLSANENCRSGYDIYGFRDPGAVQKRRVFLRLAKADMESVYKTNEFRRAHHALQLCKMQHAQTMSWCYSTKARVQSASQAASALPMWEQKARAALETARVDKFNSEADIRDADAYLRLSRSRLAEVTTRLVCDKVDARKSAEQALRKYDGIEEAEDEEDSPRVALEKYCRTMEQREKGVIALVENEQGGETMTANSAAFNPASVSRKRSRIDETSVTLDGVNTNSRAKNKDCCHQSRRPKHKALTQQEIDEALTNGRKAESAIKNVVARQVVVNRTTQIALAEVEHSPEESRGKGHERHALVHNLKEVKHEVEATQRHIWGLSKAAACASLALDMAREHPRVVTATVTLSAAEQALETAKKNKEPAQLWLNKELDNGKKAHEWEKLAREKVNQAWEWRETARVQCEKARKERDAAAAVVDALPEEIMQGFQATPQNLFKLMVEESYYTSDDKL